MHYDYALLLHVPHEGRGVDVHGAVVAREAPGEGRAAGAERAEDAGPHRAERRVRGRAQGHEVLQLVLHLGKANTNES